MMDQLLIPNKREAAPVGSLAPQFKAQLMELEGECRIKEIILLRFDIFKAVLLSILVVGSGIGIFLMKNSKKLRAKVLYTALSTEQTGKATHVYIKGEQGSEEISEITRMTFNRTERYIFHYKKLKYQLLNDEWIPLGFPYVDRLGELRGDKFLSEGLGNENAIKRQQFYGKNEHCVQVPGYVMFLFDTMTKPFFIFQYIVSAIFILKSIVLFGITMIGFAFITTSINYVLTKRSYNKIKETAEKIFTVRVLRDEQFKAIDNVDIVPGDLYEPSGEIPCDSIVLRGELFVDEVNLTGENVPIAKFSLLNDSCHNDKSHWLFQGSIVETAKQRTIAIAINVGYSSQRGRIIRKILNKSSKQPQFFTKLIFFQLQVMMVSLIIYFCTLSQLLQLDIEPVMVVFRLLDFITYSFPAAFPIFFNLAYSFCLVRLNRENIIGTKPEKTVQGSRMKTICFDKTGTLTLNKMEVAIVFAFTNNGNDDVTALLQQQSKEKRKNLDGNALISAVFACCNSVELIGDIVKGDEIDLRMFDHVKGKLFPSSSQGVVREVAGTGGRVEILKINQYESQFQSMSVLVRDITTGKLFIFVKGSPEMIHQHSTRKVPGFDGLIKRLSFAGFRSIGFGYKEIAKEQLSEWLVKPRQQFLEDSSILGVVTFVNQLKADAKSTVSALAQCEINAKIITGDNIFLGVQTAFAVGMIPQHARVTVIQGRDYVASTNSVVVLHLSRNEAGELEQSSETITDFRYNDAAGHYYAIDNDFIRQNPNEFLHNNVKVFARTSPESKALIVKKIKQGIVQKHKKLSFWHRVLSDPCNKVGMVGDGANDLIALKEADLGIGISSSDAVFSSCFAVSHLTQILQILCQSKSVQRQILEMSRYYLIISFLTITSTLILTFDASYHTSIQLIYLNFFIISPVTMLFAFSKSQRKLTAIQPDTNFMGRKQHLVFWLNTILLTAVQSSAFFYYYYSSDFVANPLQEVTFANGWNGLCKSSTANFLIIGLLFTTLPIFLYKGYPWKQPLYKNIPFSFVILANSCLVTCMHFLTARLGLMDLQPIGIFQASVILGITLIGCGLCGMLNWLLEGVQWRDKPVKQGKNAQMMQQHQSQ